MERKPQSTGKTVAWVYGVVLAFAATYLLGGIMLDKYDRKREEESRRTR